LALLKKGTPHPWVGSVREKRTVFDALFSDRAHRLDNPGLLLPVGFIGPDRFIGKNPRLLAIEWAGHRVGTFVHDVGVDHGRLHVFVSQQLLHGADVVAGFKEVGGEGVAESVAGDALVDPRSTGGSFDRFLEAAFVNMVATYHAGAGVFGKLGGGEDVSFPAGFGIFAFQGIGEVDAAVASGQVFFVYSFHMPEVLWQEGNDGLGEDGHPVFHAFGVSDNDLVLGEIEVFDS